MQSISKTGEENRLISLFNNTLLNQTLRVVELDLKVGPSSILRVYLEKLNGEGATLGDCAQATRSLNEILENESIPEPYTFEVSSPGLDRRLRLKEDFEKVVGNTVKLVLSSAAEGYGANIHGKLTAVADFGVEVIVPGKPQKEFLFDNIKQANRVWEYGI